VASSRGGGWRSEGSRARCWGRSVVVACGVGMGRQRGRQVGGGVENSGACVCSVASWYDGGTSFFLVFLCFFTVLVWRLSE